MLNEILDTQKIQRSNFNVKLEDFDLNRRIRELVSDWNILAGQKTSLSILTPGRVCPR
ncbi:MAG: hypothetical protein GY940_28255 [bacterium]|nr:hypothetical protein [bacterium]